MPVDRLLVKQRLAFISRCLPSAQERVHEQPKELYEIIGANLQDIRRFAQEILAYISQKPTIPG
ncbi:MAG: hypothetical protein ACM3WT_04225 [Bacillota bacterium]